MIEVSSEPMVFLLIACGLIYLILGDRQEAILLLGFLFLIIGITVFQEQKAEHALEALRDLSSPRALVLRDGEKKRVSGREVVRDDIAFVNEGDRVPADGSLLSGSNVSVDESLLTGESVPVDKVIRTTLHAGTTLVRGQGIIRVTSIGIGTELGKIGKSIESSKHQPTQLEIQTRKLVWTLSWIAGFLCLLVVVVYGFTRANWLSGFLAGLSLAMAILPNELPAVLTIFLSLGARRISQRRVLTRKMSAIENLGSATVLCVDKTGTLTLNRMSVQQLYAQGESFTLSELVHAPIPGQFHEVLEFGILASQPDPFDPMEKAFLAAGNKYLYGTEHLHADWHIKKEYPLTPELFSISHVWQLKGNEDYVVGAKGAPEAIIDLCHLEPSKADLLSQKASEMAEDGLRVLGVAKAKIRSPSLPEKQHDFNFEFVGLVGLADPIRPGVPEAIDECKSAGIRVVMITGDHSNTAKNIGKQIGLTNPEKVVTGAEIDKIAEYELLELVKEVNIFSRMPPHLKLRLVNALKKSREVVAMTGDGVNDAPALKRAHIGIAMGGRGTDVARESAAIVLLDDDFTSIVEAIRMGRRVYTNLQSALIYLLAVHVPIAGISVLPVLLKLPLVLLPIHIAFLHLIIGPTCSIAYEVQPAGTLIMKKPPRNPNESLFGTKIIGPSLVQGTGVLISLLLVFVISLYRGQGELDARALTFTTLIIANLTLIITSKKAAQPQGEVALNLILAWIIGVSLLLLGCVLYIPAVQTLFGFSKLHLLDLVICLAVGILSVLELGWIQNKLESNFGSSQKQQIK
jgi:Ca2+-transporting ATPase